LQTAKQQPNSYPLELGMTVPNCKEKGYQSPRGGLACGVRGKIHGWTRGGRHKKHDERQRRTIQENKHQAERF